MSSSGPRSIRDRLRHSDPDQVGEVLRARGDELMAFAEDEIGGLTRTELSYALQPLVSRLGKEINRLSSKPFDVEEGARAVRSIFETSLIIRYVAASRENTVHWIATRVKEEGDILRASLTLEGADNNEALDPIRDRIEEVDQYLREKGMEKPKRLPRWSSLAESHGLKEDYRALYGVFSKYVHPSAWTLVKPDTSWDPLFSELFLVYAQMYAFSGTQVAADALGLSTDQLASGSWSG